MDVGCRTNLVPTDPAARGCFEVDTRLAQTVADMIFDHPELGLATASTKVSCETQFNLLSYMVFKHSFQIGQAMILPIQSMEF